MFSEYITKIFYLVCPLRTYIYDIHICKNSLESFDLHYLIAWSQPDSLLIKTNQSAFTSQSSKEQVKLYAFQEDVLAICS